MEKYGTYKIFKNTQTNEVKRIPFDGTDINTLEKTAGVNTNEWVELEEEVLDEN
jgi:hypothetical protein